MKIFSRDQKNSNDDEIGEWVDYQHFLQQQNNEGSEKYHINQTKALVKLVYFVIENELTDVQREVVMLVKVKGIKSKEAADLLGVNPSTICRILKSAQKKFDRAKKHYDCIKHTIICDC